MEAMAANYAPIDRGMVGFVWFFFGEDIHSPFKKLFRCLVQFDIYRNFFFFIYAKLFTFLRVGIFSMSHPVTLANIYMQLLLMFSEIPD